MAGVVKPRGPHHLASSSGSVHALNTMERGARTTRFIPSASSLGCTLITRLLVDVVTRLRFASPDRPGLPLRKGARLRIEHSLKHCIRNPTQSGQPGRARSAT